jgi:hypothetical protein
MVDVFGGGTKRDLSPTQRALVRPGEELAKLPDSDAEITVLGRADALGLRPRGIATTRDFCPGCTAVLKARGATITSPRTAIWPGAGPVGPVPPWLAQLSRLLPFALTPKEK